MRLRPNSYAAPMRIHRHPARNHMRLRPHMLAIKESPMLDLLFLGGGVALLVLMIAYARLTNRI
jgi:hypothetical protein